MQPYRIRLDDLKRGDTVRVCIANTVANVCYDAKLFETAPDYYVGPYHEHMKKFEKNALAGGLLGNVRIIKIKS